MRLSAGIAVAIAVLFVAGCGGGDDSQSTPRVTVDPELQAEYPDAYSLLEGETDCAKLQENFDLGVERADELVVSSPTRPAERLPSPCMHVGD